MESADSNEDPNQNKTKNQTKLEPYLGFLHSTQYRKPSLFCDFMELYRYLIDDFLIEYSGNLNPKDFIVKTENVGRKKQGKREYLNDQLTRNLINKLGTFFESTVDIPRINIGKKQIVETLINEEAFILSKFLRNERIEWVPRMYSI